MRNRLYELFDDAPTTTGTDIVAPLGIFDNSTTGVNANNNYGYDALGNLVRDDRANILAIDWTVAGKVKEVDHATGMGPDLSFAYGADGQRIEKTVGYPEDEVPTGYREHYIRDAQGNIMATYRFTNTIADGVSLKLTERPVYGSSRLGSLRKQVELYDEAFDPQAADPMLQVDLNYQLTDHLGNVCAVVTGRLLDGNGGGTPKQADLLSAQGYEPGGSLLPGRNFSSSSYNYGFNGMRKDDEVYGAQGTSYTAEFWQYDSRTCRRWNIDPVVKPFESAYATFNGNPIWKVDPKGNNADEFDSNGKKISDLGGDKIDFYHQKNGDTKIVDRASGESNMITGGEKWIRGHTQRDASVGPVQVGLEWDQGTGPTNSMFGSFDGETTGPFESLRGSFSLYSDKARREMLGSHEPKGKAKFKDYSDFNPFIANGGWEQMIGRANVNWYKLGDKVLYLVRDSKSWESLLYRAIPESWNYERSPSFSKNGNTYQTYIWTETMTEVQRHVDIVDQYWHQQLIMQQQQLMVGPKY